MVECLGAGHSLDTKRVRMTTTNWFEPSPRNIEIFKMNVGAPKKKFEIKEARLFLFLNE